MRLSLRTKLLLGFGSILLFLGIVAATAIRGMAEMDEETADITGNRMPALYAAEEASVNLLILRESVLGLVIQHDKAERDADVAHIKKATTAFDEEIATLKRAHLTPAEQKLIGEIEKLRQQMRALEPKLIEVALANEEAAVRAALPAWRTAGDKIHDQLEDLVTQIEADADREAEQAHETYTRARTLAIGVAVFALLLGAVIALAMAQAIVSNVNRVGLAARKMSREDLPSLVGVAQALAEGDLTREAVIRVERVQVTSQDEIGVMGEHVNQMIDALHQVGSAFAEMGVQLRDAVGQVQVAATGLAVGADQLGGAANQTGVAVQHVTIAMQEIAAGAHEQTDRTQATGRNVGQLLGAIEQVARGADEQSRSLVAASKTALDLADGVAQVAALAQSVATESQQTQVSAGLGAQAVERTVEGMREIHQVVAEAARRVEELGKLGEKIGAVVETIDEISDQTNLLALNAAIEAARAGEHGRGFAIVADEVRKLAERSQRETKAIADLIRDVQTGTRSAVTAMDEGARKVEAGSAQADQAGLALGEILKGISRTVEQITSIASGAQEMSAHGRNVASAMNAISASVEGASAATEQMAASANEVGQASQAISRTSAQASSAIEEIAASAEEMSAQVEEVAASAEEMAATAGHLNSLVGRFKLDDSQGEVIARRRPTDWGHQRPRRAV